MCDGSRGFRVVFCGMRSTGRPPTSSPHRADSLSGINGIDGMPLRPIIV